MTDEQRQVIESLFKRYGSASDDVELHAREYLIKPEKLDTIERVLHYDKSAEKTIEQLEKMIEKLQIYRIALCDQYNFLQTAPKKAIVKLKREKSYRDNKVYYYIMELEKNLINENETLISSKKFSGKVRKKAFEEFEEYIKNHPGVIAIKEIEKESWER